MNRLGFLKKMILPVAAASAAKLDPKGEPISDSAPLVVINAPGAHLSNFKISTDRPRSTAIQMTAKAKGGSIDHGHIEGQHTAMKVELDH